MGVIIYSINALIRAYPISMFLLALIVGVIVCINALIRAYPISIQKPSESSASSEEVSMP